MVNLNLSNQKYKEKGKELGLPFEEPSSSHFPSTPRVRRNFIEAWMEEGRWKIEEMG